MLQTTLLIGPARNLSRIPIPTLQMLGILKMGTLQDTTTVAHGENWAALTIEYLLMFGELLAFHAFMIL